jgi:glycosyltransferase involved in cell wall biosynthesis
MVAGVETQFQQLRRQQGFEGARVIEVHPYRQGALIERLPLPSSLRGTIRSSVSAAPSLLARGLRAVWTQVAIPMLPFALSPRRTRLFYAIDCTPVLLHRSGHYRGVDSPSSPQGRLTAACLRLYFRHCAALLPWSTWAARSMINDYGAAPEKVHVVPPGIDVDTWQPVEREGNHRPRLLFVGADFERKGGTLLLDVYQRHLRDECELHMVTRQATDARDGVHVHSGLKSGDAKLRELYQTSDALVLPTLADCYSMAALEAMACGLPIVISAVGGIPEIVVDGHTGILIEPGRGDSLLQGIRRLLASAALRRRMGDAGRRRAEMLFDSRRQVAKTLDIMAAGVGL